MNKKILSVLLTIVLAAGLLAGCIRLPLPLPSDDPTKPAPTETEAKTSESATPAPTEATSAPTEETSAADPYFTRVDDGSRGHFTNGAADVLFRDDGSVVYRAGNEERTLLTIAPDEQITISLIGVTNERLYFGWNEVEDWWGVNVYSVDYQGGDRREYGSAWDPLFEDGWLVLLGFRSDVSPTELLLIDRNDRVAAEDQTGAVWDAKVVNGSVYYLFVEDFPVPLTFDEREGGWDYDLIRVDADGGKTVVKVFAGQPYFYSPAFINEGVICFYDTNEFYDLLTLEPAEDPYH